MTMSDTPRTDAHVSPFKSEFANEVVAADFARQLERELSGLRAELEQARKDAQRHMTDIQKLSEEAAREPRTPEWTVEACVERALAKQREAYEEELGEMRARSIKRKADLIVAEAARDAAVALVQNLVDQIHKFAEEQGEADFYTGDAVKFLRSLAVSVVPKEEEK